MIITDLKHITKTKTNVYIDYEYAFFLYRSDFRKYRLKIGESISKELYDEIIEDTVFKHGKQKALSLLKYSNRSEFELRSRLNKSGFGKDIIDRTIQYIYKYNYINDELFTQNYIRIRKYTKSRRQIEHELYAKGINKELSLKVFETEYNDESDVKDPEITAIEKAIKKKTDDVSSLSLEDRQKLKASLYRRGFNLRKIRDYID